MTERQIVNLVETTLIDKMIRNPNYIRYTFYEVNVKYPQEHGLEKQDIEMFLQLLRAKLKNDNYQVYSEGQKFEYNDAKRVVESNEIFVAIKQ